MSYIDSALSFAQSNADRFIIGVINQVQNFRHHLRHRRSGDLHGLPFFQLAAVHLPPGDKSHRPGVGGGEKRRRTEYDLVRLDRDDSPRGERRELPRHAAS